MNKKMPPKKPDRVVPKPKYKAAPAKVPPAAFFATLPKNLLLLLVFFILFFSLKKYNPGYAFVFDNLVRKSDSIMKKYPNLTYDEKMEAKVGFNFWFLNTIKKNTPEDAVIIMPPDSVFYPKGKKLGFTDFMGSIGYTSYFVYPRKLVYEGRPATIALYQKATHVAIVNFWGYDKLSYPVERKEQYAVMPIKNKPTGK